MHKLLSRFVKRHINWYAFDATSSVYESNKTAGPYPKFMAKGIARYMTKNSPNQWDYHWTPYGE